MYFNKDMDQAMKWFRSAAELGNEYAAYRMGCLLLLGEEIPKDVEVAVKWLNLSAEKGNQYAQYALGKLYLCGRDISRDREKAVEYLTASAEQGNLYASFLLEHLDACRDPSLFLAATRLLHHLEKLFCEEVQRPMEMKRYQVDRKRRTKLSEKKQAQGHHSDDQEPTQGIY